MDNKLKKEEQKIIAQKKAVALKYDTGDVSPRVIASGQGYMADKLLQTGDENKIPVYRDEKLVNDLQKIELGANIPPELYEVVAKVLIFISDLDKQESIKNMAKKI